MLNLNRKFGSFSLVNDIKFEITNTEPIDFLSLTKVNVTPRSKHGKILSFWVSTNRKEIQRLNLNCLDLLLSLFIFHMHS